MLREDDNLLEIREAESTDGRLRVVEKRRDRTPKTADAEIYWAQREETNERLSSCGFRADALRERGAFRLFSQHAGEAPVGRVQGQPETARSLSRQTNRRRRAAFYLGHVSR